MNIVEDTLRDNIHKILIAAYCSNCSTLLLVVANLFLLVVMRNSQIKLY